MTDAVAIARSVIAGPRRVVSAHDFLSICRALVEADLRPQISNELAAAARTLIEAEAAHTLAKGPDGYAPLHVGLAREMAFLTFKRFYEEEFPNAV